MGKYQPVSAAEKYAEWGDDRPRCKCHGETKGWHSNGSKTAGGSVFCRVKAKERLRVRREKNPGEYRHLLRDRYQRLKGEGICVDCGAEPLFTNASCYVCSLKKSERSLRRRMLA